MAGGETNIGGIVGFLRLEAGEFHREIQQALLEVESLQGKDVSVGVRTNGGGALERLPASAKAAGRSIDELTASQRRLEDATKRVNIAQMRLSELNESGKAKASQLMTAQLNLAQAERDESDAIQALGRARQDAATKATAATSSLAKAEGELTDKQERSSKATGENRRQMGLLLTAIGTLGPALVPVAAGAVGLAAGFAGMATAGILAFKGISDAMAANNAVGHTYQTGLSELRVGLEELGATAASGLLAPFQQVVEDITTKMGSLNEATSILSAVTGDAAEHLINGLLNAFIQLQPLIQEGAGYVDQLARKFDELSQGSGIQSFGDYVQSVLPLVMETLGSLVTTVGNLIAAFAPFGGGVLNTLRLLSEAINRIDPSVLSALATAAGAVFIGFKSWQALSGMVSGLGIALQRLGVSAEAAATGMRSLNAASAIIAIAMAGLSWVLTNNAESQRNAQQATDDYAEALRRSNGVIDESVRKVAYDTLLKGGAVDAAKKLGIGLDDLTKAATGDKDAMARVNAVIMDAIQNHRDLWGAAHDLRNALRDNNGELANAQQQNKDLAIATGEAKTQTDGITAAQQRAADQYGWSATTMQAVTQGQQDMARQTEIATAKMQEQNDAAGLLKMELDKLNGKAISNLEAQDAYAKAGNSLGRPMKQAQDALATAEKQKAGLADPHVSAGASKAVADAQLANNHAIEKYNALQASGKASASALLTARQRVETTTQRLAEAEAKAGKMTGGASQAQRDAVDAAIAQAKAQIAAAKALTGNSDAAIQNRENILSMVKMGNAAVGTSQDLARTNEGARKKLIDVRENIVKTAVSAGMSEKDVRALLDTIDQVPDSVPPTKFQADTAPAKKDTKEWVGVINGVPTWRETKFTAKTADALAAVATVRDAIEGVRDKTVTIQAVYQALGQEAALQAHNALTLDRHGIVNANGSIRMDGVQKMADGGFPGRQSTIMRSTKPILWNEAPGGEAYISLAPQKRARSLAIHEEVGRILGAGGGAGSRMHPDDIRAIGAELAQAVRSMPRPRVDLDEFNRRLA